MNYAELTANIEEICEVTFTADQLSMFVQQTERKVYQAVDVPVLQVTSNTAMTAGNQQYTLPEGFLYPISFASVSTTGVYSYLLEKDITFIQEAYPNPATTGVPKHYALLDGDIAIIGPTPAAGSTAAVLTYAKYPESIVTASTTWLGDAYPNILLNGALVEAIRFMKGEEDMVKMYDKLYLESMMQMKNFGDGRLQQDVYRSGAVRQKVQ